MKKNHEPIDHAILVLAQMEIDLHRIAIQSNDAQGGLISDCAELRVAKLNRLRHIKEQWIHSESQQAAKHDSAKVVAPKMTTQEITLNALSGTTIGDPEIAPEPQSKREPSALAEYRRRTRWANRLAWTLAIAAAFAIIAAVRFAFTHL